MEAIERAKLPPPCFPAYVCASATPEQTAGGARPQQRYTPACDRGWEPQIPLEEELARTYRWIESELRRAGRIPDEAGVVPAAALRGGPAAGGGGVRMRALITGGAGFIGSHLAEALLAREEEVIVLDDLSTGSLQNILHLMKRPGFQFILGSILDSDTVNRAVGTCDVVYHLGAAVGVRLVFEQPVRTIETNVKGTQNVLDACLRHGRKVLIASTSEVYGKDVRNGIGRFVEEDDITIGPSMRWCYATSKALDEFLARAYWMEKGLPVVIARFFNTVGPRQSPAYGMVMPRFVEQALQGKPITVYGDGSQVRTFTWVGDTVDATVRLMETPKAEGEVFNVGSDEAVTIRELAERVRRLAESDSEIVFIPHEQAYGPGFEDIRYRVPDITRLRRTIGYRPTLTLDEIIGRVIEYTRQRIGS